MAGAAWRQRREKKQTESDGLRTEVWGAARCNSGNVGSVWQRHWSWWNRRRRRKPSINISGNDYKVVASMGHVRDLPKSKLGVDVEDGLRAFLRGHREPEEGPQGAEGRGERRVRDLRRDRPRPRRGGDRLAPGRGARRGNKKKIRRLMFNEITKKGVLAAIEHPTTINKQMVDAQQARRVLDRLVGYKISPLLWDKVRRGLSAGRVQSVALKLVVRSRTRDRALRRRGVLEHHRASRREGAAGVRRAAFEEGWREHQGRQRGRSQRDPRRPEAGRLDRQRRHDEGAEEGPRPAVHHQQAAAGRALSGQEDDDGRAAALRGRRASGRRVRRFDHLHANRLDPRVGSGADGGPRVHRAAVSARSTCRRSRTSIERRRTRRTRTRRSVRRRCSTTRRRSGRT